jgi:hypothetical protein
MEEVVLCDICICHLWQVFAAGDESLLFCSCDIINVPLSMPKSRLGYSVISNGGNNVEVIAIFVVGLVLGSALELVVGVRISAVVVVGLLVGAALRLVVGSAVLVPPFQLVHALSTPFEL